MAPMLKLEGLIAATVTPFLEDGELNLSVIEKYVDFLVNQDVLGVFVAGCTGEGLTMTVKERKLLAEKWMEVGRSKLKYIIIQVGTANLKDTKELAKHAESIGCDAIATVPTLFPKPSNVECLTRYVKEVSLAAPCTPIMYYHIPTLTHVTIRIEDFLSQAHREILNFLGVKFSSPDTFDLRRSMVAEGGKFQMIDGRDELRLTGLSLGVKSAIGSTYNYMGKVYNRMTEYFNKGDMKKALLEQDRSQALVNVLRKHGDHLGVQKAFLKLRGLNVGYPRIPTMPLGDREIAALKIDLEEIGFFEWCQ